MANYIIRIFPQHSSTQDRTTSIVGLLEDPLSGKRCRFSSAEELWSLLTGKTALRPDDIPEGSPYPSAR